MPHEPLSKRQRLIIDAAKQLMRTMPEGFSMRQLAEAAGVSQATPYNLFGGKHAILSLALDEDFAQFQERFAAQAPHDAIDRFFAAARLTSDTIFADPQFYKAAYAVVSALEPVEFRQHFLPPRFKLWISLTGAAADQGKLRDGANPVILAGLLIGAFDVVVHNWLRDDYSQRRFDAELGYALASGLAAVASPQERARLDDLLMMFQGQIELLAPALRPPSGD